LARLPWFNGSSRRNNPTATPVERARSALQKGNNDEIRNALAGIGGLLETIVPADLPAKTPLPREAAAALDVLAESIGHASWHVRRLAASILIEAGEIALPVLSGLVENGNLDQVYWSCYVLARIGPKAGPLLAKAVSSQNREHRLYAIHALTRRKEPDAIATLIHALDDPVWSMRRRAADALGSRADRDKVVEALREEVTRGNRNRIFWGIRVLSRVLGEKALPILKTLITWKDDDLRYLGIVALGKLKSPEVAQLLIGYLSDAAQVVREKAVELLAAHGETAKTPLLEVANSGPPETRFWALKALWRISPDEFFQRCHALLASPTPDLRYIAVRALMLAPPAEAVKHLIACFQDPMWVLRKFASDQIVRMGDAAIPPLYRGMTEGNEDAQYWSITTLAHLGRPALPSLREALMGGDRVTRGFAISALTDSEVSEEAVALLCEAFGDEHWPIRKQAAEAVRGQGPRAVPFLIQGAVAADANRRFWSLKVLGDLAGAELPALLRGLERFPQPIQERTARALSALPADELRRVALLDPDQAVAALKDKAVDVADAAPAAPASAPKATLLPPVSDDPATYLVRLVQLVNDGRGVEAYLRAGIAPVVRVDEQLIRTEAPALSPRDISRIIEAIAPGAKPGSGAVEVGFDLGVVGRCRARLFHESRGPGVVLRPLGLQPPRLRDIGDEETLEPLTRLRTGLVLVSGPPISGRSWTAHALIDAVNAERGVHVATVEQPVEHLHPPRAALVTQLSVPGDAPSFAQGLRMALEGDARVVYLSEVPDGETAMMALEAAATTTLVIATVRDLGAVAAMRRMLDLAGGRRERAQHLLASGLRASISQVLLPHSSGKGTVVAREIVLGVPNVLHPLAQGRFQEIEKLIEEAPPEGLRSFAAALRQLVARGLISQATARDAAPARAAASELRVMEGRGA
jgi:twitching motility protein PilT